ncbi:hypothetical protein J7E70_28660 [Variovorax paradoxus]|nr:hypothetical protein [Variovorax paradoxus]
MGFWWNKATRTNSTTNKPSVFAKSYGILCETFGVFEGTDEHDWFLTDGGHFENTGAYALLGVCAAEGLKNEPQNFDLSESRRSVFFEVPKGSRTPQTATFSGAQLLPRRLLAERAEVIVIADCGADPKYGFEDLENLVRKARIDLHAEILFQRPKAFGQFRSASGGSSARGFKVAKPPPSAPLPEALTRFGSLNDLASSTSTACLALAKVNYAGQGPGTGILIVIKPNLCSGLPVDLVNFKKKNPEFPQETTADQFFSEAQWESYFHLGTFLGQNLTKEFLYELISDSSTYFENDDCSPFEATVRDIQAGESNPTAGQSGRIPARIGATAAAVGTTLSLGAAATLGVTAWQAIETTKDSYSKRTADERAALRELADLWAKATSHGSAAPDAIAAGNLAAALLRTADNLCPTKEEGWFIHSDLARRIHQSAFGECNLVPEPQRPLACKALLATNDPRAANQATTCLMAGPEVLGVLPPPRYWVYDYTGDGSATNAHPCDKVVVEREGGAKTALSLDISPATTPPETACHYTGRFDAALKPPPLAPAPAPGPAPRTEECKDITVYRQIYGPEQRKEARAYREPWERMGANLPRSEDVVDTARSRGYSSPIPVATTTVRFHDAQSFPCAYALGPSVGRLDWNVEPLSAKFRPRARTIEVWVAPKPGGARAAEPSAQRGSMEATPPPVRESQIPK